MEISLVYILTQRNIKASFVLFQDEEHEVARMAAPLMFAFASEGPAGLGGVGGSGSAASGQSAGISGDTSGSQVLSMMMRVGTGLHREGKAQFCRRFNLQPGSTVRRLRVAPKDSRRVDLVYIIGIDVRLGKGRYRNTHIVTVSPRY